ncbi:MAG: sigma-70 family RNA polymerase sigma factor [Planctomycetales bacterium]|nr:sigma-70 family RNA polymerase sigma factor [Planctomycetales bacterium]
MDNEPNSDIPSVVMRRSNGVPANDELASLTLATDAELLMRFTRHGDESAFEQIVTRHGAMVLGVSRQILRDAHAAEDAFQATFLLLAKRGDSVRRQSSLAAWLYRIAYRTSLLIVKRKSRRQEIAMEAEPVSDLPESLRALERQELQRAFWEEMERLPTEYQQSLLLCALEGRSRREASELLECTEASLKGRLTRARKLLRMRLARRGLAFSVALGLAMQSVAECEASLTAGKVQSLITEGLAVRAEGKPQTTELNRPYQIAQQGVQTMFVQTVLRIAVVAVAITGAVGILASPLLLGNTVAEEGSAVSVSRSRGAGETLDIPATSNVSASYSESFPAVVSSDVEGGGTTIEPAANVEFPRSETVSRPAGSRQPTAIVAGSAPESAGFPPSGNAAFQPPVPADVTTQNARPAPPNMPVPVAAPQPTPPPAVYTPVAPQAVPGYSTPPTLNLVPHPGYPQPNYTAPPAPAYVPSYGTVDRGEERRARLEIEREFLNRKADALRLQARAKEQLQRVVQLKLENATTDIAKAELKAEAMQLEAEMVLLTAEAERTHLESDLVGRQFEAYSPRTPVRASSGTTGTRPPASNPYQQDSRRQLPETIEPGVRLKIQSAGLPPDALLAAVVTVEASGKIALGPLYGRVEVRGLTLEEAEEKIVKQLSEFIREPRVQVTFAD